MLSTAAAPTESAAQTVRAYWMDVAYIFPLKALVAGAITWFTTAVGLSSVVFFWYCSFTVLEFITDALEKITYHQWCKRCLGHWVYRVVTQLILAALVGGLFHMISDTTGTAVIAGVNWVLILCATVDFGSIIDSLTKIGAPVPAFFNVIARGFKRKSAVYLGNMLNDPEARAELEKALGVERPADTQISPEIDGIPNKG